jgi:4-aminobutyrate aminotransferase
MTNGSLAPVWAATTTLDVATGEGCWVTTTGGDRYLDFTAGIAVASTGHCHPHVVEAIREQAGRFIHAQVNCYRHDLLQPLAEKLAAVTPASISSFFYSNSGAEITEAAVKLAKAHTRRPNVIVFDGSFHGRTHLAMAMTNSKTSYRSHYAPLPAGIHVAPFPDPFSADVDAEVARCLHALRRILATQTAPDETAAIVIEPVLGEGGYIAAPHSFLCGIADLCAEAGILFVADEVQTGFGRTGTMFAVEQSGVEPDILMMAKGLASGFPISALGARGEVMDSWKPGSHGGTYGGNPIGCAAAMATIDVVNAPGFLDAVNARGSELRSRLQTMADADGGIRQVRGVGLMNAIQFSDPSRVAKVQQHCLAEGRLILMSAGSDGGTIRFMPPLVVSAEEISLAADALEQALKTTA